jgi:hypothetical protein
MPVSVTVRTNDAAMMNFLYGATGAMVPLVTLWGEEIRSVSVRTAPRRSGLLANSHTVRVGIVPGFAFATISANTNYAYFVNRGTGIHGPKGRIIKARKGKVFAFEGSGAHGPVRAGGTRQSGGLVFARSTKGSPANPYLETALHAVMDGVPGVRYRRFKR